MNIFEITMMVCFGSSWPFSIYKSYVSRSTKGKSLSFLCIVLVGYLAGILHKINYSFDYITILYVTNFLLVLSDIVLFFRNSRLERQAIIQEKSSITLNNSSARQV